MLWAATQVVSKVQEYQQKKDDAAPAPAASEPAANTA
jgi:hypothetical protein